MRFVLYWSIFFVHFKQNFARKTSLTLSNALKDANKGYNCDQKNDKLRLVYQYRDHTIFLCAKRAKYDWHSLIYHVYYHMPINIFILHLIGQSFMYAAPLYHRKSNHHFWKGNLQVQISKSYLVELECKILRIENYFFCGRVDIIDSLWHSTRFAYCHLTVYETRYHMLMIVQSDYFDEHQLFNADNGSILPPSLSSDNLLFTSSGISLQRRL